jgi:hypothetical protein
VCAPWYFYWCPFASSNSDCRPKKRGKVGEEGKQRDRERKADREREREREKERERERERERELQLQASMPLAIALATPVWSFCCLYVYKRPHFIALNAQQSLSLFHLSSFSVTKIESAACSSSTLARLVKCFCLILTFVIIGMEIKKINFMTQLLRGHI